MLHLLYVAEDEPSWPRSYLKFEIEISTASLGMLPNAFLEESAVTDYPTKKESYRLRYVAEVRFPCSELPVMIILQGYFAHPASSRRWH